eukprot:g6414.t1
MEDISPLSPGIRRRSLPASVQHRPAALEHRPGTVPASTCRGGGDQRAFDREETPPVAAESRQGDLGELQQEEWIRASWKKGERREEIKLIAEASGLAFVDARIVALRLYNHFNWLPELQERSEQLLAVVGRERRLSLSLVRNEVLAQAARRLPTDSGGDGGVGRRDERLEPTDEDEDSCATAEGSVSDDSKDKFNRYVRGLCVVCNEGSVDQRLDVLLRAYSVTRDDSTITRNEMAAILAKHVLYEDAERRVIPRAAVAAKGRDQDGGFISWDSARELLRRGPQCLENSLAIDLPCLSKDLWSADLVDVGRTHLSSSFQ